MENISLSPWELWSQSLGWALLGIIFVKAWVYPHGTKFDFNKWCRENILDIIRGLLLTLVIVKLGDIAVQLIQYTGFDTSKLESIFSNIGVDPVRLSLVVAMIAQWKLYKAKQKRNN